LAEETGQDIEVDEEQFSGEVIVEVPVVESGTYLYVCSACGADLTEIPYYNRYYCQNCGLHY